MRRLIKPAILVLCLVALTANGAETPGDYTQVAEDIEIMAKIIDKSLEGEFSDYYRASSMFREFQGCQGIYLKGYGAIFMTNIGFPVAEIEMPEQKDAPDELWIRMKNELRGGSTSRSGSYGISYKDIAEGYNSEKAEGLKKELLKLVGTYAPNIRNLGSGENVVVAVRGSSGSGKIIRSVVYGTENDAMIYEQLLPASSKDEPGSSAKAPEITKSPSMPKPVVTPSVVAPSESTPQPVPKAATGRRTISLVKKPDGKTYAMLLSEGRNGSRTNLIIKVSKGDIMAYKDGKLDLDSFMEKAEITQY